MVDEAGMRKGCIEVAMGEPRTRRESSGRDGESGVCGRERGGKGDCETTIGKNTTNRIYCQDKYIPSVYHWKDRS